METGKILVIDDDDALRKQMTWALNDTYTVFSAGTRAEGLEAVSAEQPDVVLLDLGLPPHPNEPTEGFAALEEIQGVAAATKVIVISGQSDIQNALAAIGKGAYDFFHKPIDEDVLQVILQRALYVARLEREYHALQHQEPAFEGMLGCSPQMEQVFVAIRKLGTTDAPVLIQGDSGTGKELAARAIHRLSRRKDGPFIPINCGAIPETLLESELFGHEKGAFTGAHAQRDGRVEMAAGGTLFLDEIGELPLAMQVKLLRFLQDRQIERVGGRKPIHVDTRVIAATNKDLQDMQAAGTFREDLYYRLAVVTLRIPPLRERDGDVRVLAKTFVRRFAREDRKKVTGFTPEALQALETYPWPGNVRELENRVKRGVIMAEQKRITPDDLELQSDAQDQALPTLKDAREDAERTVLRRALARTEGNISQTADLLGVSRPTLYELMNKLGIKKT